MSKLYRDYLKAHPNAKRATVLKNISPSYGPGRTKQSFKDSTDINVLVAKAQKGHAISHLNRYGAVYGDFTDIPDLLTAHGRLEQANQIFSELPGEIRREFHQSPQEFFEFVNDPQNSDRLADIFPDLAKPGNQRPDVLRSAESVAARDAMETPAEVDSPDTGDTGGSPA